jgi:glycosyltransferase involved in cell wall biosynthesis
MRILFLSGVLPMAWGSEVRAFRFLEYLTKRHDVDLASFQAWPGRVPPDGAQPELLAALRARCRGLTMVPLPGAEAWRNCLCNAIGEEPFQVAYYRSAQMRRFVQERLCTGKYDLVWVSGLAMAQYAVGLTAPTVLDAGGCASHRYHRLSLLPQHLPRRAFYRGEAGRMMAYEARILAGFTRCLVSSARDREKLWQIAPRAAIQVVPNTLELSRLPALTARPVDSARVGRPPHLRLAFAGDLYCQAHRDAALYLCRRILPRVWRVLPKAEVMVIGPGQPRFLRALAHTPGVGVTGYVGNYQGPLAHAAAVVFPLRADTGFPVQVVEAMACGKPAIVSPLILDGLGLRPNDPVLTAESAAEFAELAAGLLQRPELAERMGGRARQLVLDRFDIRSVADRLDDILGHLAPPPRGRRVATR